MDGGRVNFLGILYQLIATGATLVDYKPTGAGDGEEFEGYVYPEFYGADAASMANNQLTLQQMKCSGAAQPKPFDRDAFQEIIKSAAKTLNELGDNAGQVQSYQIVSNRDFGKIQEFINYRDSNDEWAKAGIPDCLKDEGKNVDEKDGSNANAGWSLKRWLNKILCSNDDTDSLVKSAIKFLAILEVNPQYLTEAKKNLFDWYQRYGFGCDEASTHLNTLVGRLTELSAQGGGKITLATLVQGATGARNGHALDELGPPFQEELNRWAEHRLDSWGETGPLKHFVPSFWDEALKRIVPVAPTVEIDQSLDPNLPKKSFLFHAKAGRGKTCGLVYLAKKLLGQGQYVIPLELTSHASTDINRTIDELVKTIAGWNGLHEQMLDRLVIANTNRPICILIDGLNEKVGSSDGIEYAKALESIPRSRSHVTLIMSLRSDEGGQPPSHRDLPDTDIIEVEPIPTAYAMEMFGFANARELFGNHVSMSDDIKVHWNTVTEPLLFDILCDMDRNLAQKAIEHDGSERGMAIVSLCNRVAMRAKKKLGLNQTNDQVISLLAELVGDVASVPVLKNLPASVAYQKAEDYGVGKLFIDEMVQLGFFDRIGPALKFRYPDEYHHMLAWAKTVLRDELKTIDSSPSKSVVGFEELSANPKGPKECLTNDQC
jgi:hypothetical protein